MLLTSCSFLFSKHFSARLEQILWKAHYGFFVGSNKDHERIRGSVFAPVFYGSGTLIPWILIQAEKISLSEGHNYSIEQIQSEISSN
jgi:hypothetical protein